MTDTFGVEGDDLDGIDWDAEFAKLTSGGIPPAAQAEDSAGVGEAEAHARRLLGDVRYEQLRDFQDRMSEVQYATHVSNLELNTAFTQRNLAHSRLLDAGSLAVQVAGVGLALAAVVWASRR